MNRRAKRGGRRPGRSHALTTADLVVLSLLEERPMHGYDLLAEYRRQEVADWASISKAQLYYALGKLEGLGLLRGEIQEGAARGRTVYRPTPAGLEALGGALADLGWAEGRVAQPFLTWFGLSIHASEAARATLLDARLAFLDREIAREEESLAYIATLDDPRAAKGADIVRLTVCQLRVERDWVAELLARTG
jgi:DNA-binding PadR family transcriptional regulator